MSNRRHWLIWDGSCGLCYETARRFRARDTQRKFQIVSGDHCPTPPMTPSVRELLGTTVVVITSDGKILTRSQAIFFVLEQTGWGWFAKALASPPLVWIMNIGYGLVARNRAWLSAKFFGRTACGLDNRYPEIDSLSYLQQNEPTVKKT